MRRAVGAASRFGALVACIAAVAGCGGDDGGGSGGEEGPTPVKVGVIPIVDVAPLYLGREKGFFEAEGLEVEPVLAEGGAAIVPSVASGDLQLGFSNVISLFVARSRGLPVKIIAEGTKAGSHPTRDNSSAVLAPKGGDVRQPKDLEGKTVAVNTLSNIMVVATNAALEKDGVDVSTIKYVEVPFPEMIAALEAGRVDAVSLVEPFVSLGQAAGHRQITAPFEGTAPKQPTAAYFTTERYIEEQPDVVERFVRAMNKSLQYAEDHPDEARRMLPTYTEIPAEATKKLALPNWDPELDRQGLERLIALTSKYRIIDKEPSIDELIE